MAWPKRWRSRWGERLRSSYLSPVNVVAGESFYVLLRA
jgi:hypothetical protein